MFRIFAGCLMLGAANAAHAYIGPGAGISAIGSLLALGAAVLLAIVGFVWYPLKRLRKRRQKARAETAVIAQGQQAAERERRDEEADP